MGSQSGSGRILRVARMGEPVLGQVADDVIDPQAPAVQNLIRDMLKTVHYLDCAGLAAPQVYASVRLVVFRVPAHTDNPKYRLTPQHDPEGVPWTVMINPVVEPLTSEATEDWEGCLSLPGLMGLVPRFSSIRYAYLTPNGQKVSKEAHGFHARVVQHECDHLEGILYPQRISDPGKGFGYQEEIRKHRLSPAESK